MTEEEAYDPRQDMGDLSKALSITNFHKEDELDEDEEYEDTEVLFDKTFLKFQKRIKYDADQIIRYARSYEDINP